MGSFEESIVLSYKDAMSNNNRLLSSHNLIRKVMSVDIVEAILERKEREQPTQASIIQSIIGAIESSDQWTAWRDK